MITGEIAILFASAAGIGAAAATWVYDRRLAKRLTDLRRDVDYLKDQIRGHADMLVKTETAIVNLRRPITVESPLTVHVKGDACSPVSDVFRAAIAKTIKVVDPEARHPLYAKTGLPNQPVASLRPDTPKPNWDCPNCSYRSYQPLAGKPRCPICKGLEITE